MTETHSFYNPRPKVELTKDRRELAEGILKSRQLGVRLIDLRSDGHFGSDEVKSNFAVYRPANPTGSRVFIHGRDIFSKPVADFYFSGSVNAAHMPYSMFGDGAKGKVRRALSPEGLFERIDDYKLPKSDVEYVRQKVTSNGGDATVVTEKTAYAIHEALMKKLEEQGHDHRAYIHMSEQEFGKAIKKLRPATCKFMQDTLMQLRARGAADISYHYEGALTDYIKTHQWDPEIVRNFAQGVTTLNDHEFPPLEAVIKAGLEKRVEQELRQLVDQVSNPYTPEIMAKEKEAAELLAKHMQPRLLENALRTNTAIILTNDSRLGEFADILGYTSEDWSTSAGVFSAASPVKKRHPVANNFIIIGGGNTIDTFDVQAIRRYGRHELEHHRDLIQDEDFLRFYDKQTIEDAIMRDRAHFKTVDELLKRTYGGTALKPKEESILRKAVPALAMIDASDPHAAASERNAILHKYRISVMPDARNRCSVFFNDGDSSGHYATKAKQKVEIPAIIAELSALHGSAEIKALLPNLTKLYREHRLQNAGLRNDSQGILR